MTNSPLYGTGFTNWASLDCFASLVRTIFPSPDTWTSNRSPGRAALIVTRFLLSATAVIMGVSHGYAPFSSSISHRRDSLNARHAKNAETRGNRREAGSQTYSAGYALLQNPAGW